jgi:hypothetical protein
MAQQGVKSMFVTFEADTAETQAAITRVDKRLDVLNAKAKVTKANTLAAGKAAKLGIFRGGVGGVTAADGAVTLSRGKFTIGGGFLRGAGGALVLLSGVAHGTVAIAEAYERFTETKRMYGTQEAQTRFAAAANRVFMSPFRMVYNLGTGAISAIMKASTGSEEEALDYRIRANQLWDETAGRFSMSSQEREEKWERYREALRAAKEEAAAYLRKEMEDLATVRPTNVRLRTSEDVAAYKEALRQKNGGIIARDAAELEKAARLEVKRTWAED